MGGLLGMTGKGRSVQDDRLNLLFRSKTPLCIKCQQNVVIHKHLGDTSLSSMIVPIDC